MTELPRATFTDGAEDAPRASLIATDVERG
jgi:hypothetical protein